MKNFFVTTALLYSLLPTVILAQNNAKKPFPSSEDSLQGFDEKFMQTVAISCGFLGAEMDYFMANVKKEFIRSKYHLPEEIKPVVYLKPVASACVNEDFEDFSLSSPVPGTVVITTTNGISGWACGSGINTGPNGTCLSASATTTSLPQSIQGVAPTGGGLIDPLIGPTYPIYSVFGNSANGGGTTTTGVDTMRGDWFIKLNETAGNANMNRIAKTINVTPLNSVYTFAFLALVEGSHCCCDSPGFTFYARDCSNNILANPQFTIAPTQASYCTGGTSLTCSGGNPVTMLNCPVNPLWYYNKWKVSAIDMTPYIGSCITIEVTALDCTAGGHGGYCYYDSQCSAMQIMVNNRSFPAVAPTLTVPTCSDTLFSISALDGFAPYSWTGPAGFAPSNSRTINTNILGTYTLSMGNWGTNPPVVKYITLVSTPGVSVSAVSSNSVLCVGNSATLTASGGSSYSWSTGENNNPIVITPTVSTNYTVSASDANNECSSSTALLQVVSTCTGIKTNESTDAFMIFPNPNKGEFTLKIEKELKGELVIENMLGQIVFKQAISGGENKIKTKELAHGVYNYKIVENKTTVGKGKLVIE